MTNPQPNPYVGKHLFAFDTETHLIQPGLLAPPLVCGSWATSPDSEPKPAEGVLNKEMTHLFFKGVLESHRILVGHNLAYDLGVMCAHDRTLVPLVFAKLDRDEAFDTLIAEQLIEIHQGTLGENASSASGGGHSLADLARKYLGRDRSADKHGPDSWRLRYAELDGVPLAEWPEAARAYPIQDARDTYDVAAAQIADGRNLHDLPAQLRAHWALHLSAMWGVRTDKAWVETFVTKVTAQHEESRARLLANGLLKVRRCMKKKGVLEPSDAVDRAALVAALNAATGAARDALDLALDDLDAGRPLRYSTDKKALEAAVASAYAGKPPMSAKGNIRTNKDALKESDSPLLRDFADSQEGEKFYSTYLKVLEQGTRVPINARINILVASGRTSYSKPNLQNIPRGSELGKPREAFVARPGTVWSSNDYPTLELRTLAYALEYLGFKSAMAAALRADRDLHVQLAAQIKGVTYEAAFKAYKAEEKWAVDFRQMAKAANFGLPGGLGPVKLVAYARQSYNARFCLLSGRAEVCGAKKFVDPRSGTPVCQVCLQVAQSLRDTWFDTFPEMRAYFALVKEWTSTATLTVTNDEGEHEEMRIGSVEQIVSERVRGRCNFTNGANTVFQGLAADIAKRALWLVSREMYTDPNSPLWGSRLVVFVHDELIAEHPEGKGHAGAFRIAELMNQAFFEFTKPDPKNGQIPCDVRPALMRRWHKEAKEAYAEVGGKRILVPWPAVAARKEAA